jgi:2-phospho-L-lactate guanylyltransferase
MATTLDRTWAIVPLRGLEDAKTRLGAELDAEERLDLVVTMASRTLAASRDASRLRGTVLVTADPAAARLAETFGALTVVQHLPGLNAAIREARTVAVAAGASAVLVLPIDLPAIQARAIDEIVEGATTASRPTNRPIVAAVPDHHGSGTNALLVAPPDAIEPAFGERSFEAHRRAAAEVGARWIALGGPLGTDLDTGADLIAAESAGLGSPSTTGPGRGDGRDAA